MQHYMVTHYHVYMLCIAAACSVLLESVVCSLLCAMYNMSGTIDHHCCIIATALWSDVVCLFYVH